MSPAPYLGQRRRPPLPAPLTVVASKFSCSILVPLHWVNHLALMECVPTRNPLCPWEERAPFIPGARSFPLAALYATGSSGCSAFHRATRSSPVLPICARLLTSPRKAPGALDLHVGSVPHAHPAVQVDLGRVGAQALQLDGAALQREKDGRVAKLQQHLAHLALVEPGAAGDERPTADQPTTSAPRKCQPQ